MRMFIDVFDQFLPPERQEASKGPAALIPTNLRNDIDHLNAWVYDSINNGVYKVGFANNQAKYNEHVLNLFQALDRLEQHLTQSKHQPFLFGAHVTDADIRLYTTLIRFDMAYYTMFKCNLKMIRTDYPHLHAWLRRLYWSEGPETGGGVFKRTTLFDVVSATDSVDPLFGLTFFFLDQTRIFVYHDGQWRGAHWADSEYYAVVRRATGGSIKLLHANFESRSMEFLLAFGWVY